MKKSNVLLITYYTNILFLILLIKFEFSSASNNVSNFWGYLLMGLILLSGVLILVFGVLNVREAYNLYHKNDLIGLRNHMKLLKLGLIPYYVINLAVHGLFFLSSMAISRGLILFTPFLIIFFIPIGLAYLSLLFSSAYSIGYLILNHKSGFMKWHEMLLQIIFQFIFIIDVLSTLFILIKYKDTQRIKTYEK